MKILKYMIMVVIGLAAAELYLGLTLSPTLQMSKWFTGPIHTPDPAYGFVFTPDYDGWMRHPDQVFLEKLDLGPDGFRTPYTPSQAKGDVVMIGGYSVAFSYGLSDENSMHYAIGRDLATTSNVYMTAWPGYDLYRNFHIYQRELETRVKPLVTVISFWGNELEKMPRLPSTPADPNLARPNLDELFYYDPHHVMPRGASPFQKIAGRSYFKSQLVFSLCNSLDRNRLRTLNILSKAGMKSATGEPASPASPQKNAEQFAAYVNYLNSYFTSKGSKVLFVFMPFQNESKMYYKNMVDLMPPDVTYLDLNNERYDEVHRYQYIAINHLSADQCRLVGQAIAGKINEMMK